MKISVRYLFLLAVELTEELNKKQFLQQKTDKAFIFSSFEFIFLKRNSLPALGVTTMAAFFFMM